MSDERDFCETCGSMFGSNVNNSACKFYTDEGHLIYICVPCFEELDGYNEKEQYERMVMNHV